MMIMTRAELIDLVLRVYAQEITDEHHARLIAHRPVAHLRDKGYLVTTLSNNQWIVNK